MCATRRSASPSPRSTTRRGAALSAARRAPPSAAAGVGHGNTEEQCRLDNLGCRQRGRPGDPAFDPRTGKGYFAAHKGHYHDALARKRSRVAILLHEYLGGGFCPVAACKIRRMGRRARSGLDRTKYRGHRPVSYVSHHTRAISMGVARAEAWTFFHATADAKSKLCRLRELGGERIGQGGAL